MTEGETGFRIRFNLPSWLPRMIGARSDALVH
jgi:hypothetical protein